MHHVRFRSGAALAGLLLLLGRPVVAFADTGSCEYRMFSKQLGRSFLVCQTADSEDQCGAWPRPTSQPLTAGFAVGKAERQIDFSKKSCDQARVVASCQLSSGSKIHFYEGDMKELASGCQRMYGRFVKVDAETAEKAEADAVLRLINRSPQ